MLSAAKHLLFLIGNKRKQIPSLRSGQAFRSAPDDNGSICSKLLPKAWWVCVPWLLASCSRAPSFALPHDVRFPRLPFLVFSPSFHFSPLSLQNSLVDNDKTLRIIIIVP